MRVLLLLLVFAAAIAPSFAQSCNPDEDAPAPTICPVCRREGVTSRVYQGPYPGYPYGVPHPVNPAAIPVFRGGTVTYEMVPAPATLTPTETVTPEPLNFFDEHGCWHEHAELEHAEFHCSRGHEFTRYFARCWCGWPENAYVEK